MTSGTKTQDDQHSIVTQAGPGQVGQYYQRTWSGGDQVTPKPPKEYFVVSLPYTDRRGRKKYTKHRVRVRHAKPKRTYRLDNHGYNSTVVQSFDVATMFNYGTGWFTCTIQNSQGAFALGATFTQRWTSNDDLALIGKLREKIAGSDFNCLTFLAEGHQSLELIANAANRVSRMYDGFRTGNIRKIITAFEGIDPSLSAKAYKRLGSHKKRGTLASASALLEVRYGWQPLLQDAEAGAIWLANLLSVPLKQKYTVRRTIGAIDNGTGTSTFPNPGDDKTGYAVDTRGKLTAYIREMDPVALSGLSSPLATVWEKVPFSFVADWFIPIGSYLAARGLAQALTGEFVTTKTVHTWLNNIIPKTHSLGAGHELYKYKKTVTTRTVSTSISVPLPAVKPLGKSLSWVHCQNAVALVVGLSNGFTKIPGYVRS